MPFRHVALYRWSQRPGDDHLQRLAEALDALAPQVPGVRSVTHGPDAGLVGEAHDHVVVIDVEHEAAWRTLRDHPAYILLVEELITPFVADRAVGQFRLTDPAAADSATTDDVDVRDLSDDELMERARRAAQASMDALLAEPDDTVL